MEWTKEERYRRLEDTNTEEISGLAARVARCPWRQGYHIQPETGLLNDPNGFAFFMKSIICSINVFLSVLCMVSNIGIIPALRISFTGRTGEWR